MVSNYLFLLGGNYYRRLMPVPYAYIFPSIDESLLQKTKIARPFVKAKKKQQTTDELYLLFK
jgi:hypothetical protein